MNAPTSLALIVEANPALVLLEPAKFDQFFDEVAREVRSHVPDLTTNKGREAIASLAMKVSKTKTAIDAARELLTKEKRDEIKAVDAAGKIIRDRLDALRDEVKQPLVEWKAAEEARTEACQAIIGAIKRDGVILGEDTSETVAGRLDLVRAVEITDEQFGDLTTLAQTLKDTAISQLEAGAVRLRQAEEDRAELAQLRAAEEARQAREAEERAAAETKAAEERAERERVEAAERAKRAEDERIANAAREAEERARAEAERAAQERQNAERQAHEAALAAEKRRADDAEAARKAEADRIARDETKRLADAKAAADAQAAREADIEHKSKVMGAAKDALVALGIPESKAKAVVLAIKAGEVPNVSIRF